MKKLTQIAIFMFAVCTMGLSQTTQLNNWYIAPQKMDMSLSPPVPSLISQVYGTTTAGNAMQVANGLYDNTGKLLFYVSDGGVYDYNNTLIGFINNGGTEVAIVPFENNTSCFRKFNIFTTTGGFISTTSLWRAEVDMNSFTITSTLVDTINYQGNTGTEFGAIAVGKVTSSNSRYLYFLAGPGTTNSTGGAIKKITIDQNGTVTLNGRIYPSVNNPNTNAGVEVFAQELDLSPDGKYLAWGSYAMVNHQSGTQYRYHLIELDGSGAYINNSYKKFNIPNITGNNSVSAFRGVEFFQSANTTKLFIGAGTDGIFYINLPWTNWSSYPSPPPATDFFQVTGSSGINLYSYGQSQLELANNGKMYAASDPTGNQYNLGAFDPLSPVPQILGLNSSFTLPNVPHGTWGNSFYTLPDQIDGQNYSSIITQAVAQVATTGTYTFGSSGSQNTTWTNTINPWNTSTPVQVIKELRIVNNSNLTINGMMFKFSPNAKVIIEPGSTLTLDGGAVLTSDYLEDPCLIPYTWQGVEVWGSQNNQSQNIVPSVVGKLIVNNATIEYAVCGARAQRNYGSYVNLNRGGIIIATADAKFKNCHYQTKAPEFK